MPTTASASNAAGSARTSSPTFASDARNGCHRMASHLTGKTPPRGTTVDNTKKTQAQRKGLKVAKVGLSRPVKRVWVAGGR